MRFPSLSLSRERLNLPFLFFTLGLSLLSWKMRMLSSRSRTSISRSASCCSLRFNSSSCDFCCRAARVSSSSLERSSWKKQVHRNNSIAFTNHNTVDADSTIMPLQKILTKALNTGKVLLIGTRTGVFSGSKH